MRARRGAVLAVLGGVLTLGATPASAETTSAETTSPTARPAPHIDFGSCEGFASTAAGAAAVAPHECGYLEVPLDHADPDGASAQIAVLRVPARGERIGSLVVNPGGPGFGGVEYAAGLAAAAENPVLDRFDLVGFDPRGTGATTPSVDCFTDAEREDDAVYSNDQSYADSWDEAATRELVRRCAQGSGGLDALAHLGTRDTVQDLDLLRQALGEEQLTYHGVSYGTRLGAVYAETFPDRVRAMTLDGPMDPWGGTASRLLSQFDAFQTAFEDVAAFCSTLPECPLGPDPTRATERFQELVQPLVDQPLTTTDGRELTHTKAVDAVLAGLYAEEAYPAIVAGLLELRAGGADTLMALRDSYHQREADGRTGNALEANLAINCLDEQRMTPQQATEFKRGLFAVAPFTDPGVPIQTRDGCEHWPVEPTLGHPYAVDVQGLPSTLTIAATGDPATPYAEAGRVAEGLNGVLLTVEAKQHGVAFGNNACVDDAVARYLIDLEAPDPAARC